jgi:hypothetical protein
MPYGCDPILTSFISIMTSSSDCSGEGAKRTHQGLWRMPDEAERDPSSKLDFQIDAPPLGRLADHFCNKNWHETDMKTALRNVRFGGRADVVCSERVFPVLTQNGLHHQDQCQIKKPGQCRGFRSSIELI